MAAIKPSSLDYFALVLIEVLLLRFERHSCGGEVSSETTIQSPVHPSQYFHNTNCTWVITAPEGKVVEVK